MTLPLCPSGDSPCGCCSAADTLTHSCARAHTAQSPAFSRRPASLCTELLCSENFFHKMAAMCLLHSKIFILLFRVFFERKTIFLKLFYLVVCVRLCMCMAYVYVYGICIQVIVCLCVQVYLFMDPHIEVKEEHLVSCFIPLYLICLILLRQILLPLPTSLSLPSSPTFLSLALFLTKFGASLAMGKLWQSPSLGANR